MTKLGSIILKFAIFTHNQGFPRIALMIDKLYDFVSDIHILMRGIRK